MRNLIRGNWFLCKGSFGQDDFISGTLPQTASFLGLCPKPRGLSCKMNGSDTQVAVGNVGCDVVEWARPNCGAAF